ncbi:uncharacterized protein LOC126791088 [Argentina anserina]|uniref:uncharacterized protein LOC126791088 n=1 Tax=Argentina anserina TaxID=57926 RepID=UPI0021765E15|nr:uncharacterized protein LOC126791088 [Potentilla anserina]
MGSPASPSLPPPSIFHWKYDVFLTFRGEDTREGFLSYLYHELQVVNKIQTFKDDTQLEVGAPISPTILKAIEESRLAIVVLSENYASSSWCLEELTKICHCMEDGNRILPLFYHVNPSDVRKQNGSFKEAFTKHENDGRDKEKVKQWREALAKVANFSGWHTLNYKSERQLLNDIVTYVHSKVKAPEIELTYGEREIRLPKFVMWKAKYNNKYLRLTKNDPGLAGFIKFNGNEATSPYAMFELQKAETGNSFVHIRCCYNSKYLVRSNTLRWIVAAAEKPEENKSKISCTLFELEPVDKTGGLEFRFRHIQMRMYACLMTRVDVSKYGGLFGDSNLPDKDECDVYTLVDGESAYKTNTTVVLPRFVALKDTYNNKYLRVNKK